MSKQSSEAIIAPSRSKGACRKTWPVVHAEHGIHGKLLKQTLLDHELDAQAEALLTARRRAR